VYFPLPPFPSASVIDSRARHLGPHFFLLLPHQYHETRTPAHRVSKQQRYIGKPKCTGTKLVLGGPNCLARDSVGRRVGFPCYHPAMESWRRALRMLTAA
jgi:hypothetical protein